LVLCSTEAAGAHKQTYPVHASEYGSELSELIERGRETAEKQVAESLQERAQFIDSISRMFQEVDLLLSPTLSFPVPRLGSIDFTRMTIKTLRHRRHSRGSLFSDPSIYRAVQFQRKSGD
jgi:Asp-tRNA(Asn)/Glu-tRNA(Gln) amidotransferase A subunit family amidase